MNHHNNFILTTAHTLAELYAAQSPVEAVALGGSRSARTSDAQSDIDLYVYCSSELPLATRAAIVEARAARAEIGNSFFESGDEWLERHSGISLDVMFRDTRWLEDQIERTFVRYEAWVGYTTCFWYNIRTSDILFDRTGWFTTLHTQAQQPYPEQLRRAIVAKNYPLLRTNISSFSVQIKKALQRGDTVSVNHRIAAFLASYFDVLFALNTLPHPGEKRLVRYALDHCSRLPTTFAGNIESLLGITYHSIHNTALAFNVLEQSMTQLVDELTILLHEEHLL
jgi:predicted nucleotidyltransferase